VKLGLLSETAFTDDAFDDALAAGADAPDKTDTFLTANSWAIAIA
jgi:hypothetical protein